jgi:hypothetical protein
MKASWKFFAGLLAGFVIAFATTAAAFCLNLGVPTVGSRWAAEMIARKRMLAAQSSAPRTLLVGASGTLTGVSAREIERQTGIRAINLGAYAALGTAYILRETQAVAKPGDTVLLLFEYELYDYGKVERSWANAILVDYLVARDPAFLRGLSLTEQWNVFMLTSGRRLIEGLKNRRRWKPLPPDAGIYTIRNINEWGDQTHHTRTSRPPPPDSILGFRAALAYGLPERPKAFPIIAAFCKWAQTHQIRVLASFPNLCDQPEYHLPAARQTAGRIRDFFSGLGVPVVGEYTDSLIPADQFFDTAYHPTEEAALVRTRLLVEQLAPNLK